MTEDTNEVQSIIDLTREAHAGELRELNPVDTPLLSVTIPSGYARETIDLTKYLPSPLRASGTVSLQTVDDFAKYVARHDDGDATTIWADMNRHAIAAVLDDHWSAASGVVSPDERPGWGEHRATLALKATDEWTHWLNGDGIPMDQEKFAEHIEDGQVEIVKPEAAELLEIVQSMQGHTDAQWKSAKRLHDGSVQFLYSEDATATAGGKGELEIPQTFELMIAPFLGEDVMALTARLRYRVKGGNLSIGYKLVRPGDVVRDCIDQIADRLASQFGTERTFVGVPRSAGVPF